MGGVVVKIKDNIIRCETAVPNIKHNIAQPKFECKIQGVVIQGGGGVTPVTVSVVDGTTYAVEAGKYLLSICPVPASGDRVLSAGYSAGATQVLDNEEILSNEARTINILRRFHTATTLHFSDFTGSLILYFL